MPVSVENQGGIVVLANDALRFTFSIRDGRFSVRRAGDAKVPAIVSATAQAVYRSASHTRTVRMDDKGQIVWKDAEGSDAHGAAHHSLFYWTGEDVRLALTAVMYDDRPFMLLRLALTHRDPGTWEIESLSPLVAAGDVKTGSGLRLPCAPGDLIFYRSGWTSWSPAYVARFGETPVDAQFAKGARTAFLNAATPASSKSELWSESFTLVGGAPSGKRGECPGLMAGFASLADQFTAVGAELMHAGKDDEQASSSLRMLCECDHLVLPADSSLASEWAYLQWVDMAQDDPLADYAQAVARQADVRVPARGPVGWSSGNQPSGKLEEQGVMNALNQLAHIRAGLPIELVEVGAGYAEVPGDWTQISSSLIPHGMAWVEEQIRQQDYTPALWVAPFVVHPDSLVVADHREWLLQDGGHPVTAGVLDGSPLYALDVTHPEVLAWLAALVRRLRRDWGFPCLELDWVFAAALPGKRHDAAVTRAQALRRALQVIRETAGPETTFVIAAKCPLGPAVGLVSAMRVGPQTGGGWFTRDANWAPLFKPGSAMPGARNAIRNVLTRSALHRRWWLNDPGCLALADLSDAEACSLASVVGLSGGMLVFEGDLEHLAPARRALLEAIVPSIPETGMPQDLLQRELPARYVLRMDRPCGRWAVAGVFNWADEARDIVFNPAEAGVGAPRPLHVYDFWARQYHRLTADEFLLPQVPAHGGVVLGMRPLIDGSHLVASSFHVSQGGELGAWELSKQRLSFTLSIGRRAEGEVLLWLPDPPRGATSDGRAVSIAECGGGVWALRLRVDKTAQVEVVLA